MNSVWILEDVFGYGEWQIIGVYPSKEEALKAFEALDHYYEVYLREYPLFTNGENLNGVNLPFERLGPDEEGDDQYYEEEEDANDEP